MNLWADRVLPWLIDRVMGSEILAADRARCVGMATGTVVEVGAGSGHNLRFYGPAVTRLLAVDPSRRLWEIGRRRRGRPRFPVDFVAASASRLPLADAIADTVVVTWSLCSIPDVAAAVREMRRVLRTGGRLLFVEHGAAVEPGVRRWQERLSPAWSRLAGGCRLDRRMDQLLEAGGFRLTAIERGYRPGPRIFSYTYKGIAVPGDETDQRMLPVCPRE